MDNLKLSAVKKRGGARAGAGQPPYQPMPADRATVRNLVVAGYSHERIAACIGTHGISERTLRKHFRRELDTSKAEVDAFATNTIIELMKARNLGAACFYLKCRVGWQETQAHRFVNEEGRDRPFRLSDADRLVADADEEIGVK
jgi:hypothetical protein